LCCFSAKAKATNSSKLFHQNRKHWTPGKKMMTTIVSKKIGEWEIKK
jgi:hypothetical protein